MKSPVLFIIFKREDTTGRVFERIREVRPPKLYIAADGPRPDRPGEAERCEATRKIVENVDWPCEVHRLFQDKNLGCGKGVSTALSWFFSNEPEGIVIEDDILPHPDFFTYCDEMLERFRDDERVSLIAGRNNFFKGIDHEYTYYMSRFMMIWGWASWRRVWEKYEFDVAKLDRQKFDRCLEDRMPPQSWKKFRSIYDMMAAHGCDTWDYQLFISFIMNRTNVVLPYVNMVENIGIGSADAAHTVEEDAVVSGHKAHSPYPIVHPEGWHEDPKADYVHMTAAGLRQKTLLMRARNAVRLLVSFIRKKI